MSTLVAVTFDQPGTAEEAMRSVRSVEKANQLGLSDTAVISKDADGKVHVDNEWSSGAEAGAITGGILGLVTTFIFPVVGTVVGVAVGGWVGSLFHTGVEKSFIEEVTKSLTPGSSALLMLVKDGNPAALTAAFKPFEGKVYQTTLSTDLEDSLKQALKA